MTNKTKKHVCKGIVLTRTWETHDSFWGVNALVLHHSVKILVCKTCGKKLADPRV